MDPEDRTNLLDCFHLGRMNGNSFEECIQWAVEQVERGRVDPSICILAGLEPDDFRGVKENVERVLDEETTQERFETWAGRHLVQLAEKFWNGEMGIQDLERSLHRLSRAMGDPEWLVMLVRNCEYALDLEDFEKPFQDELHYIVELWKVSLDEEEFRRRYCRRISDGHDVVGS